MIALVLDVGNSKVKFGVFENGELNFQDVRSSMGVPALEKILQEQRINACILSTTRKIDPSFLNRLQEIPFFISLSHQTPLPIRIAYTSPETLGKDRIAAAVAVHDLWPNEPALAIDAGTCITYELVDKTGTYIGGQISPGLYMRFKAMHQFTGGLPKVEHAPTTEIIGHDTTSSMQSGVQRGMMHEVKGFIAEYQEQYPGLKVALTGGDLSVLLSLVENEIFAEPNLILNGLHKILTYNAKIAE